MNSHERFVQEVFDLETELVPDLKVRESWKNQVPGVIPSRPIESTNESKAGAMGAHGIDYSLDPVPQRRNMEWVYFAPSYFAESALLDPKLVKDLKKGKRILSIGAGPAYLERFLTKYCATKDGQIVLVDLEEEAMPKDFHHYSFDALEEWPIEEQFDYVLYPESFSACVGEAWSLEAGKRTPSRKRMFWARDPVDVHVRLYPSTTVSPIVSNSYHLFQSALKVTKPGGEVRAQHFAFNRPEQEAYIIENLRREFAGLVRLKVNSRCFVLKKAL